MHIASQYEDEFDRAVPEALFAPDNSRELTTAQLETYVPVRPSSEGAGELWLEERIYRHLTSDYPEGELHLVGDAGSGKSSLLQFVLYFYQIWRDEFEPGQELFDEALAKVSERECSGDHPGGPCIPLNANVPSPHSQMNIREAFTFGCKQIRAQILARYPTLPYENNFAMIRPGIVGPAELGEDAAGVGRAESRQVTPLPEERRARFQAMTEALVTEVGKAEDFCAYAVPYLTQRRPPAGLC